MPDNAVLRGDIRADSEFMLHLFSRHSAKQMSARGEQNWLSTFVSPTRLDSAGTGGDMMGYFGNTPVSMAVLRSATMRFNKDLNDEISITVRGQDSARNTIPPKRVSLRVGSGALATETNFLADDDVSDAQLTTPSTLNLAFRIANAVRDTQGDYSLMPLTAMRGTKKVWGTNPSILDAKGANWTTTAKGPLMQTLNELQESAGSDPQQLVRPRTRVWRCGTSTDVEGAPADFDDGFGAQYTADNEVQWDRDLHAIKTYTEKQRYARQAEHRFEIAEINMIRERGHKKMSRVSGGCVLITTPDVVAALTKDENWVKAQLAASGADGKSTGVFTDEAGMYRGWRLHAVNKLPMIENTAGVKIQQSLVLGKSALLILHTLKRKRLMFGLRDTSVMHRFAETWSPVDVETWPADDKARKHGLGFALRMGAVVPAFHNSDGNLEDLGVLSVLSNVQ